MDEWLAQGGHSWEKQDPTGASTAPRGPERERSGSGGWQDGPLGAQ